MMTEPGISNIIHQTSAMTYETACKLADALNVRKEYLLLMDDYMTAEDFPSAADIIYKRFQDSEKIKELCQALFDFLGYKIIDNENGVYIKASYKRLILETDTAIPQENKADLSKELVYHYETTTEPYLTYIITPEGKKIITESKTLFELYNDVLQYTKFRIDNIKPPERLVDPLFSEFD